MITLEQKKKLQFDASIPDLPTDLTYECRIAIAGEGKRGLEWQDKPHRLDMLDCEYVLTSADRIEKLVKELNVSNELGKALEEDAGQLRDKLAKAVAGLKPLVQICEMVRDGSGFRKGRYQHEVTDSQWSAWCKQIKTTRNVLDGLEVKE